MSMNATDRDTRARVDAAALSPSGSGISDRETAVALMAFLGGGSPGAQSDRADSFMAAGERIGWESLTEKARMAWLAPLLYSSLKAAGREAELPAEVLKKLRGDFMLSSFHSMRAERALVPVFADCAAEGIPVILLKGICLATTVYGNAALRPMTDVDILVEGKNIPRAHALLEKNGYLSPAGKEGMMAQHLPQYFSKSGPAIELHFTIMDPATHPGLDVAQLFARAVPVGFGSSTALVMAIEDTVLHLCEHLAGHHLFANGRRGLVDIARTIGSAGDSFDWEAFMARAQLWSADRACALAIILCVKYAGLTIPGRVGDWIMSLPGIQGQIAVAEDALFGKPPVMPFNLIRLSASGSLAGKLRFLAGILFPSPETMRNIMAGGSTKKPGGHFLPYLYAVRFAHLWKTHSARAWQVIRKKGGSLPALDGETGRIGLDDWLQGRSGGPPVS